MKVNDTNPTNNEEEEYPTPNRESMSEETLQEAASHPANNSAPNEQTPNTPLSDDSNTIEPDGMLLSAKELEFESNKSAPKSNRLSPDQYRQLLLNYIHDPDAKETKKERASKFFNSIRISEEEARQIWKEHIGHEEGFRKFEQQLVIEGAQLRAQRREEVENTLDQIEDEHVQDDTP